MQCLPFSPLHFPLHECTCQLPRRAGDAAGKPSVEGVGHARLGRSPLLPHKPAWSSTGRRFGASALPLYSTSICLLGVQCTPCQEEGKIDLRLHASHRQWGLCSATYRRREDILRSPGWKAWLQRVPPSPWQPEAPFFSVELQEMGVKGIMKEFFIFLLSFIHPRASAVRQQCVRDICPSDLFLFYYFH